MKLPTLPTFAERIKFVRSSAGLSQRAFAELVGRSPGTIAAWEAGNYEAPVELRLEMGRLLNVDPIWLLSGRETESMPGDTYEWQAKLSATYDLVVAGMQILRLASLHRIPHSEMSRLFYEHMANHLKIFVFVEADSASRGGGDLLQRVQYELFHLKERIDGIEPGRLVEQAKALLSEE